MDNEHQTIDQTTQEHQPGVENAQPVEHKTEEQHVENQANENHVDTHNHNGSVEHN
jgi:hypothetical protein